MIIIFTSTLFISYIFLNAIKYEIEKRKMQKALIKEEDSLIKNLRKNISDDVLFSCTTKMIFGFMFLIIFLIPCLATLSDHIKDYNKYYFKEKNEAELLILENNIFSGTIIKWWTKDYPKIQ